jgi:phosphohistidine swiveling domain-containing protein
MKKNNIKPRNREIILAWTRDFTLAWAEWWSKYMNPRLEQVFGVGVPNQLDYFNGKLLETYRPFNEAMDWIKAVVNIDLEGSFLSKQKTNRYLELIREIKAIVRQTNKEKNFFDPASFTKLRVLSEEMYPWYTVCYLLPQEQWSKKLIERYPKRAKTIISCLVGLRQKSEGTIQEMVEYWRVAAKYLLTERGLSNKYVSFVTFTELENMFRDKNFSPKQNELEDRFKSYVFFRGSVHTKVSRDAFFVKQGFIYKSPVSGGQAEEIRGTVASLSQSMVKGTVQVISRIEEVASFKKGNILVTVMTNPFFVPAMKKAIAIVTDEGGITSHAAIVARELKKPCIIGTKIATKVLRDGDLVEVDANKGIIRKF